MGNSRAKPKSNKRASSTTSMPGRQDFYRDAGDMLVKNESVVLMSIEVDGLSFILRTFGPDERNKVVAEIIRRMEGILGDEMICYQVAPDNFALMLVDSDYFEATEHTSELVVRLREPFLIGGVSYGLRVHAGISHFPNHAETVNELVRTSAFACFQARTSRALYATFDKALDAEERHRFHLMVDLERCLKEQEGIQLAYQPIVHLGTGKIGGVEGLCRWEHSRLGMIPPGDFLPYAERSTLISALTALTLGLGLDSLASWQSKGFDGVLSINLSPSLFNQPGLFERFKEQLKFHNISPECINFEITETGIMEHPNTAVNILREIRDYGSTVSVDDFGTGHSSLAYLADLPVDCIKIDRHFIHNLSLPWGEAIVGATAVLAQKLKLTTVAEGIESEEELLKCQELGVTSGQGYFIGRPVFEAEFESWFRKYHTGFPLPAKQGGKQLSGTGVKRVGRKGQESGMLP